MIIRHPDSERVAQGIKETIDGLKRYRSKLWPNPAEVSFLAGSELTYWKDEFFGGGRMVVNEELTGKTHLYLRQMPATARMVVSGLQQPAGYVVRVNDFETIKVYVIDLEQVASLAPQTKTVRISDEISLPNADDIAARMGNRRMPADWGSLEIFPWSDRESPRGTTTWRAIEMVLRGV